MNTLYTRKEVMKSLGKDVDGFIDEYLIPIEKNWQPSDLLPDFSQNNFASQIRDLQESAKELPYDFWVVLVGDAITEEALPTYESWLMGVEGVDQKSNEGWARWISCWTAEENRHGDLLNKYLYLSGKVNMREIEVTTQHLIADGFDIATANDPYKNFVYTSFQELATFTSHNRVADIAKKYGADQLSKMCKLVASDEMRHHRAYSSFVKRIFEIDPSEMMLAFLYMMKNKIVMPALFVRESGNSKGSSFEHFSDSAQRLGVYTTHDYIDIMRKLINMWELDKIRNLSTAAEKARDYLMALPARMEKISERLVIPAESHIFKWVEAF